MGNSVWRILMVLDAAEAVIAVSDRFKIGMPPEMEDAIEFPREALEEQRVKADEP